MMEKLAACATVVSDVRRHRRARAEGPVGGLPLEGAEGLARKDDRPGARLPALAPAGDGRPLRRRARLRLRGRCERLSLLDDVGDEHSRFGVTRLSASVRRFRWNLKAVARL